MIKILCPEPTSFSEKGLSLASNNAKLFAKDMNQDSFEKIAPDFDVILIRFNTRINGKLLADAPRIKAILSPTTGLDHIDMIATKKHGVKVYHLKGQKRFLKTITSTAELTIGLLLASIRNLPFAIEETKKGNWNPGLLRGKELSGKFLGIIGCGRLGSKVARIAISFGMQVIVYDPFISRFPAGVIRASSLDELLTKIDIVSLHVHLSPETKHMISKREFSLMKKGTILINTSRGALIESRELIKALTKGRIAQAALDVLEDEQSILRNELHPLIKYANKNDNLIITPHIGGSTYESIEKTDMFILKKYFNYIGISTHQ